MAEQRDRLEHFLFSVNLLFTLALAITLLMVLLLIRQHLLQRREIKAQAERRRAEEALHRYDLLAVHSRDIILFMQSAMGVSWKPIWPPPRLTDIAARNY